MGFMFFIPSGEHNYGAYCDASAKYALYAQSCAAKGETPLSREEWDKKEAEKKQPPEEPSDYMK